MIAVLALLLALAGGIPAEKKTFSHDVWPILQARCVACHQAGEIAPMAFTSYRLTRPWAAAIREAVLSRGMPPWHASKGSAHPFRNDRSLSEAEIKTIAAWVEGGAPEGEPLPAYVPPPREHGWSLGSPDKVVGIPGFAVPKTGPLPYSFLIVPLHLDHDTWVRAAEFRIEHRAVIHHINAFIRSPGSSFLAGFPSGQIFVPTVAERGKKREGEGLFDRRQLLQGYEPGYIPMPWLEDGAKLIPAGSDLIFEMHYSPNGTEVIDHSEVALYFAKKPPVYRVVAIDTLRDLDLKIPPQDRDYHSNAAMTLARPARLLSIQPHMHLRGKSMAIRAVYPDGTIENLLTVPKYDFHWQTTYVLSQPLNLPAGTRLESDAGYNNSPDNPFNPDPNDTVKWGDQTTNEMHIAFLELVIEAKADPDSLFQSQPKMIGTQVSGAQVSGAQVSGTAKQLR